MVTFLMPMPCSSPRMSMMRSIMTEWIAVRQQPQNFADVGRFDLSRPLIRLVSLALDLAAPRSRRSVATPRFQSIAPARRESRPSGRRPERPT